MRGVPLRLMLVGSDDWQKRVVAVSSEVRECVCKVVAREVVDVTWTRRLNERTVFPAPQTM